MSARSRSPLAALPGYPPPDPPPPSVPWSRRLQVWRSPDDQPGWARPLVLAVAALTAFSYAWHSGTTIEAYYAAAVRSMASSWHDFIYGAFDPAGTVSVDKLPGALWVQALSARLFGFHVWSLLLPQVVEGALTVLVLYRVVQRLGGPVAGAAAIVVLLASPATTTLNRGNIPDTLMVLLMVLAADAAVTAAVTGRFGPALAAGVWVGLAFQAKMLEAWLLVPALAVVVVVAGRRDVLGRVVALAVTGVAAVAVSLSWMVVVTLTPAAHRPYVDGSANDSLFHQVFVYNGFSRLGQATPNQVLGHTLGTALFAQAAPPPTWDRLLTGAYGRDTAWLLPAALLALVAVLVVRRGQRRGDPVRAGALLWGTWLVVLGVVFTVSTAMNSYYAGALSPAVAGLLGLGVAVAWEGRRRPSTWAAVALAVLVTAGYAVWLLPPARPGEPPWLRPMAGAAGVVAALVALVLMAAPRRRPGREAVAALALAGAALLLVPATASVLVVSERLGPFDTPFQPAGATRLVHALFAPPWSPPDLASLESVRHGAPYLMATQTSVLASPYIFATGQEVLPLGGYTGTNPVPSVARLARAVREGRFHLVLMSDPAADPATRWIAAHCLHLPQPAGHPTPSLVPHLALYYCTAASG